MKTMEEIFRDDPARGAAYCGDCAKISIMLARLDEAAAPPDELGARARIAARLAIRSIRRDIARRAARARWGKE